jgi:hypothetical protein
MAFTKRVFVTATAAGARARCAAINAALGYPKLVGERLPTSPPRRVCPYFVRPRIPQSGPVAGFFILPIDHPAIAALDGQTLTVPATYLGRAVPGAGSTFVVNLAAGRAFDVSTDDVGEEDM